MSDLYDADIVLWSEEQAARLRRVAAQDRLNADSPDWDNIIEEIESVGRSEARACRSHLVQALRHALKVLAWPQVSYVPHWRAEARDQRNEARDAYTPSMRQKIDVQEVYQRARDGIPETIDGQPPGPVPKECRATLDQLLFGVETLEQLLLGEG